MIHRRALSPLLTALAAGLLLSRGADAGTTLEQVCGAKGSRLSNSQADQLCRAGYANGEAWIASDNNSRIWAPVAIVCGYTCVVGFGGSCSPGSASGQSANNSAAFNSQLQAIGTGEGGPAGGSGSAGGGGGGACGTAVQAGRKAYDADKASDLELDAAKKNGKNALALQGGKAPSIVSEPVRGPRSGASNEDFSLPDSCVRAGKGGNVQDRIDCAMATDPSIPAFVKSPQFLADFQRITGRPLQEVINKSPQTLMDRYATGGIQNAVQLAQGRVSLEQLLKGGAGLLKAMASGLGAEDRAKFVSNVLPPSMAAMANGILDGLGVGGSSALAAVERRSDVAAASGATAGAPAGAITGLSDDAAALLRGPSNAGAEEDSNVSLFERVSARYRANFGRIEQVGWALRMNQ